MVALVDRRFGRLLDALARHDLWGVFGDAISITDGEWTLHQPPVAGNEPLYWYGFQDSVTQDFGPVEDGRRDVDRSWVEERDPWLSDLREDPNELYNRAEERPEKRHEMQRALRETLVSLDAPSEQLERLGLADR